jgi:prevent-host-death family protein
MYKTVRSTTLRENLAEILESLKKGDKYLVTKRGEPVGGIVDLGLFEDLLALSSPSYLKSIKEAREQYKKGQYYTLEEVMKDLELE